MSGNSTELPDEGIRGDRRSTDPVRRAARRRRERQRRRQLLAAAVEQQPGYEDIDPEEDISREDGSFSVDNDKKLEAAVEQVESNSPFLNDVSPSEVNLTDGAVKVSESVVERAEKRAQRQASQQRQQARREFAEAIESGSAFGDLPDGIDPATLVDTVDPQQDVVREGDSLTLTDDVQDQINSQLESDALQQQRREYANDLESGAAFESGEAPAGLGEVDPQTDIAIEDGSLTLADDARRELVRSQINDQVGGFEPDALLDERTVDDSVRAARDEAAAIFESRLPEEADVAVGTQDGQFIATNIDLRGVPAEDVPEVLPSEGPPRRPDEVDASELLNDTDIAATDPQLRDTVRQEIADRVSQQVPGASIDASQIEAGDGEFGFAETPDALTIGDDEITADGLTDGAQDDLARRQLASLGSQTDIAISPATPTDSQAFRQTSARLGTALSSSVISNQTDVVAASDAIDNLGAVDQTPDTEIIAGLDPEAAAENISGLEAETVRDAQQDIQQRRQAVAADPSAALDDIAAAETFSEDASRLSRQLTRGRAEQAAIREQLNQLESQIAAGDGSVDAGDVELNVDATEASNIGGINQAGREAIAESVAQDLPNFAAGEVNVGIDEGQITTAVDEAAMEIATQQAERIDEIQARNEIADETASIDRREIAVEDGNVTLSREGVRQARLDAVDAETGSGEIVPDLQTQTQGRDIDVRDVRLEQTADGGLTIGLRETARTRLQSPDLSGTGEAFQTNNFGQTTRQEAVDIEGSDPTLNPNTQPTLADLGVNDLTGPRRNQRISEAVQGSLGINAPEAPLRTGLQSFRNSAGSAIDNFDLSDLGSGGGLAGAATFAVAAPEPVSTGTGAAVLGGIALGGAITGVANELGQPTDREDISGVNELNVPDRTPATTTGEVEVPDQTPATINGEIGVPDRTPATTTGEVDVPDQTPAATGGEINVPDLSAAELVGQQQPEIDEDDVTDPTVIGGEDIPVSPYDPVQNRGGTPERFIDENRDPFVFPGSETVINGMGVVEETPVETGVGTGTESGIGIGSGARGLIDSQVGIADARRADVRGVSDIGSEAGNRTGIRTVEQLRTGLELNQNQITSATATEVSYANPNLMQTAEATVTETATENRGRDSSNRRRLRTPNLNFESNDDDAFFFDNEGDERRYVAEGLDLL